MKYLCLIILLIFITGCGITRTPIAPIRIITTTSYPELPNIEPMPPVNLIPWLHDMPRDMSVVSVKNITECRKVETRLNERLPYVVEPVEEQSDSWWAKCGENPIIPFSNIYIGFNQENFNIILENFYKLKERIWQYEQRLLEINRQREEWRNKAEEERERIKSVNTSE